MKKCVCVALAAAREREIRETDPLWESEKLRETRKRGTQRERAEREREKRRKKYSGV